MKRLQMMQRSIILDHHLVNRGVKDHFVKDHLCNNVCVRRCKTEEVPSFFYLVNSGSHRTLQQHL